MSEIQTLAWLDIDDSWRSWLDNYIEVLLGVTFNIIVEKKQNKLMIQKRQTVLLNNTGFILVKWKMGCTHIVEYFVNGT